MPISIFGGKKGEPAKVLEEGWQFYAKPTALEPVGTIFRIDDKRRRYMVKEVVIETQEGAEAVAKVCQQAQANIGFFARFLGLDSYGGGVGGAHVQALEFEVVEPVRQLAFDEAVDRAMAPVQAALQYRADNRYYLIRETRSAIAMTYRLTQAQVAEIGGEASLAVALGAGVKIGAGQSGKYEINQKFPQRMRVMYLAEEIKPTQRGMAGAPPQLGRVKVQHPLTWDAEG